jgi:glycosyltransferase involved in cell wall biosynthesis
LAFAAGVFLRNCDGGFEGAGEERVNVLMVDQFGETGGAQKCLLDLLAGWPEGDRVVVAAPADGTLLGSVRGRGFVAEPIPCGPYAAGRKVSDALRFCSDVLRQCMTLRHLIRKYRIDIVYVNGPRVLAGATLAARGRCRMIFHSHSRLHRRYDVAIVRFALGHCSPTVMACCQYAAAPLAAAAPRVVLNGVPDAGFRVRHYPPGGSWRIGIVGRISAEKGHLVLLDAVRMLTAEGHRITVTVAGASLFSSYAYEAEVRRQAAGLDVRFTGWVEDVGSLLGGFDLLAVPSTAEPGTTRVVLEAYSAGVPVVALPSGGIPEVVRDNVTGFLSPDATPAGLAATLRRVMLGSPSQLARVIHNARAEWESYWNVERWRREVISAIRATAREREGACDSLAASGAASGGRPARWV